MMKCRRWQATDPKSKKNCHRSFSRFLLVEAEAIGVEAVDEIAASTSLTTVIHHHIGIDVMFSSFTKHKAYLTNNNVIICYCC